MQLKRLQALLDLNGVAYKAIKHSPAYTAQEIAHSAHIPGQALAKTVIVKIDDTLAMVISSANHKIDLSTLSESLHRKNIELASESEFANKFPDCELGAMPPFGSLYGLDVYMDNQLDLHEDIAFNAGSHSELLQMGFQDFQKLVHPIMINAR